MENLILLIIIYSFSSANSSGSRGIKRKQDQEDFQELNYEVPHEQINDKLRNTLLDSARAHIKVRNQLIRVIVRDLTVKYGCQLKGREFKAVARRLVEDFPSLEEKFEDGTVIADGMEGLTKALKLSFYNHNRENRPPMGKHEKKLEPKYKKVDAYGCVDYAPTITLEEIREMSVIKDRMKEDFISNKLIAMKDIQDEMSKIYPLIRYSIVEDSMMVPEIQKNYPYLFFSAGSSILAHHFERLTGLKVEIVEDEIKRTAESICKFILEKNADNHVRDDSKIKNLCRLVASHFNEDHRSLFRESFVS